MAKQIASQVGAWVKSVATVEQVDTGDILTPLKRVQKQYLDKAEELAERGLSSIEPDTRNERRPNGNTKRPLPLKNTAGAEFYQTAAINVGRMLGDSLALVVTNA